MSKTMKKNFLLITGLMVTMAVLYVHATEAPESDGLGIGDYAPDFKLPDTNGKIVSMAEYKNAKGFIIVFTCNTCPFAKQYESRVIGLDKKYAAKGYPVIAINPNDVTKKPGDSMEEMKALATEKGYTFPYLRDDKQKVTLGFGATKTPHVYVLSKEADRYRVEYIGAIDNSPGEPGDVSEKYVEDAVDALLAGKKPVVTERRAIGCTIKWKDA